MLGGPRKFHSVYQIGRKRAKIKKKVLTTSRVFASDQQASIVALAHDNGDGGDCSPLNKGTVLRCSATDKQATRGAGAFDIFGAANSGPQDKGMSSSGITSDKQATRDGATDSDLPENDCILRAHSSLVRIHTEAVASSDIGQVSTREEVMLERLKSTPATARKTAVFTDASDASY